ncbi:PEPxxWA-CTERM sorting domain-containing protein [Duganella sp.]|uniref:Npun_F0296 family exosortase-dependent surface protein n=1 Tax=Duganella sp. TaxID=1904440 RepID=UPI0031CE00DC
MRICKPLLAALLSVLTIGANAAVNEAKTQITAGQFTPIAPPTTVTFDSDIPAGIHYEGLNLVSGSEQNNYEAPAFDTTKYLRTGCCGGSTTVTFDSGFGASYFGFYLGSADASNTLTVYSSDGTSRVYAEGELASLVPSGAVGGSYYLGLYSTAGSVFTRIEFNTINPMETDNHAFILAAVPEPETYAMMLGGLALVGMAARRRAAKTSAAAQA